MKSHSESVGGRSGFPGNLDNLFTLQVDSLDQFGVGRRKFRDQPLKTAAKHTLLFGVRCFFKIAPKSFNQASSDLIASIKVNNGATQDSIKPPIGLGSGRLFFGTECFDEAFLNGVSCQIGISKARASEPGEGRKILQKPLLQFCHPENSIRLPTGHQTYPVMFRGGMRLQLWKSYQL